MCAYNGEIIFGLVMYVAIVEMTKARYFNCVLPP